MMTSFILNNTCLIRKAGQQLALVKGLYLRILFIYAMVGKKLL